MSNQADDKKLRQQEQDAEFLTENFDMTADRASKLVARDGIGREQLEDSIKGADGEARQPDPLADKPLPKQPKTQYTGDADEQARKPVMHRRNDRRGA